LHSIFKNRVKEEISHSIKWKIGRIRERGLPVRVKGRRIRRSFSRENGLRSTEISADSATSLVRHFGGKFRTSNPAAVTDRVFCEAHEGDHE